MTSVRATPLHTLPQVNLADTLAQTPGVVDLWCFFYEGLDDPALLDSHSALMTEAERVRHGRYFFERDRRIFLATRALVRTVLSQYADVAPADWRFAEGERGKPYIDSPKGLPSIHFNLSNTFGLVVCAVSLRHPLLGTDVEFLQRPGETVSIADHYFSHREAQALRAQPADRQRDRFFSYWTLKESYIKARGLGLALPLDQFSFLLDNGPDIGVTFDPQLGDHSAVWRFALLAAGDRHMVAVGVDTGGAPLQLRVARFVPLQGLSPFSGGTS